tara:strand:- start:100 stop:630 length:531 start_codon:yes stop_codon:yes gene_type:complete
MAFKMNREGFTFYTKSKGHTMRDKGYPKHGHHDKGLSKYSDTHMSKTIAKAKPDFLDADGDGNKKEPMKEAFADKASKTIKEQTPNVASNLTKTPYEKNKYSHNTMKTPLYKHNADHEEATPQTVNPDKKRKQSIINKLKTLKDPVDSSEGKRLTKILMKDYNMSADGIESEVGFR